MEVPGRIAAMDFKALENEALSLPPDDRAKLAHELLESSAAKGKLVSMLFAAWTWRSA